MYRSSNRHPYIELTIFFSGLPTSSTNNAGPSGVRPIPQQTTTILHAVVSPTGLGTVTATVDTSTQILQSALDHAESLKGALGYFNGVIEFIKEFANVNSQASPPVLIRYSIICLTTRFRKSQSRQQFMMWVACQGFLSVFLTFLVPARQKTGGSRREYRGISFFHTGYARVLIRNKGSGEDKNIAVRDQRCHDTHL